MESTNRRNKRKQRQSQRRAWLISSHFFARQRVIHSRNATQLDWTPCEERASTCDTLVESQLSRVDRCAIRKHVYITSQSEGISEARHLLPCNHQRSSVLKKHEESKNRSKTPNSRRVTWIRFHFPQHASDSRDTIHSEKREPTQRTNRHRRNHQTKGETENRAELEIKYSNSLHPQGRTDERSTKNRPASRESSRPNERTLHGNNAVITREMADVLPCHEDPSFEWSPCKRESNRYVWESAQRVRLA